MVEPTRLTEAELARLHALGCVAESGMVEVTGPEVRALVEEVRRLRARNEQLEDALMAMSLTTDIQWKEPLLSLHRCKVCDTRWLWWPQEGLWNLLDGLQRPGACCDNAPMGDQIEHLRDLLTTSKVRDAS